MLEYPWYLETLEMLDDFDGGPSTSIAHIDRKGGLLRWLRLSAPRVGMSALDVVVHHGKRTAWRGKHRREQFARRRIL